MNGKWLILGSLVLLLSGCLPAPQNQARQQADLAEMKLRLAALEREQAAQQGASLETAPQKQLADLQARLDALQVELQAATGKTEEVQRSNAQLKQELGLVQDELKDKVGSLEERLARLEKGAPTAAAPAPAVNKAPTGGAVTPPKPAANGAEAAYESALAKIRQGKDYIGGEKAMRAFLAQNSANPLAVNAMYWIGEALYGQKRYEEAILQFQDVIMQYGDHPKVAAALFKQGLAFDALKDRQSARATLQKLIDRFPQSPEAGKAKAQLKAWK